MTSLSSRRLARFLATASLFLLWSCRQDSPSPTGPQTMLLNSTSSTPAHPALTWGQYIMRNGSIVGSSLVVADTDLSHQTAIIQNSSTNYGIQYNPVWSPTGGSIAFARYYPYTLGKPDSIFAIDVSVNNKGVPVGSNLRCIVPGCGRPGPAWSSTTSMGKIAYVSMGQPAALYVVSQSGGTPASIYSTNSSSVGLGRPTWNPDDSKLAVPRSDGKVLIFSTSNWTLIDSVAVSGNIEWSRSGLDTLAIENIGGGYYQPLYYCDPVTGATPAFGGVYVTRSQATWSPNNSALIYATSNGASVWKVHAFASDTTQIGSSMSINGNINWKR
ncbi:MAG: hypothetical protein Q8922_05690 [Bacteroidota bacterium]|nr:hypothetical protein [Bacteroidota bacterium]MDP4233104.1 hypothetical protein [Bacteroidota bacterium]MDP4241751.1 hypothetical protein [Bacteroidota bacterium]MDP4287409.1 hypothetical protein [Bacteroidota bacterium]